ncbi:YphA family membrane protein [Oceanobacillus halotolerans]|uniref:YphA family membrane protein n=1 Tax=Oceanobacillus halotolerans TaxID=2663380 RepID=UPI0013DB8E75|nr:hypothetical protein [Oceanobacillus halotolerans]
MAEGLLFYWIAWMLWIIATFFMDKTRKRTFLAAWLLLTIIYSNKYVTFLTIEVSVSFIIILIGMMLLHARLPRLSYHLITSFTISIGYIAILLWEQQTPVWLFLPRAVLIPVICACLSILLTNDFQTRMVIGLVGITFGEAIYSFILAGYQLPETIGEMAFLDSVMMVIVIIFCIEVILQMKQRFTILLNNVMRWQND